MAIIPVVEVFFRRSAAVATSVLRGKYRDHNRKGILKNQGPWSRDQAKRGTPAMVLCCTGPVQHGSNANTSTQPYIAMTNQTPKRLSSSEVNFVYRFVLYVPTSVPSCAQQGSPSKNLLWIILHGAVYDTPIPIVRAPKFAFYGPSLQVVEKPPWLVWSEMLLQRAKLATLNSPLMSFAIAMPPIARS